MMALPVASTSFVKLEGQSKFIDGTSLKAFMACLDGGGKEGEWRGVEWCKLKIS